MTDNNGITVHKGKSLSRINATIKGCKDRGVQADHGHAGIDWRGGKISGCWNDGMGGETGDWIVSGTKFESNGKKNKDSGDGLQITNPDDYFICANEFLNHPNSSMIFCELRTAGIIMHNRCINSRHGLAIQLCGFWPNGLEDFIESNVFERCEYGIWMYGQEPEDVDMELIIDQLIAQNTFKKCGKMIEMEWDS